MSQNGFCKVNVSTIRKITELNQECLEKIFWASCGSMCTNSIPGYFPSFCYSRFFQQDFKNVWKLKALEGKNRMFQVSDLKAEISVSQNKIYIINFAIFR